jgi:hypothetical protein
MQKLGNMAKNFFIGIIRHLDKVFSCIHLKNAPIIVELSMYLKFKLVTKHQNITVVLQCPRAMAMHTTSLLRDNSRCAKVFDKKPYQTGRGACDF